MTVMIPIAIIAGILMWVFRLGRGTFESRKVAIFATVIPLVIVAITAIVFQLLHNITGDNGVSDISNTCFIVSLGLIGVTVLVLSGFAFARKFEIVKGMGFGINIVVILSILEFGLLEGLAGV